MKERTINWHQFLSTLSLRRATIWLCQHRRVRHISIHALLAESDGGCAGGAEAKAHFYPRSPCGERLRHFNLENSRILISIHALLAESDGRLAVKRHRLNISIHALLAESDDKETTATFTVTISIHALLAESDLLRAGVLQDKTGFLSTLSLRRATAEFFCVVYVLYISIHALLAESDWLAVTLLASFSISIHALLAESDAVCFAAGRVGIVISIHALLAESDSQRVACGRCAPLFLSTLSLRRATYAKRFSALHNVLISIHALLAESDEALN